MFYHKNSNSKTIKWPGYRTDARYSYNSDDSELSTEEEGL
jgi:hypothetical protein